MKSERWIKGTAHREKLFGEKASVVPRLEKIFPPLADAIVEFAFGDVHARPALDVKTREMLIVAMLVARGDTEMELRSHIRAALKTGVTKEELFELFLQSAVYCGFPRAVNATFLADEIFQEQNA